MHECTKLEGKIRLNQVLVAEARGDASEAAAPVGYLMAADRYQKRDEIGYVTQINVLPEYRRSLVAAQLLQAQFDRSAYGCRLYCCWCAQDLKANEFWEAMGFTAIAFRTGSMTKGKNKSPRVHLFWQKRIRDGDATTPWWYPSQTGGGELREDRLVFPILPGVHWRDVGPILLDDRPAEASAPGSTLVAPTLGTPALGASTGGGPAASASPKPRRAKRAKPEPTTIRVLKPRCPPGGAWFEHEADYVDVPIASTSTSTANAAAPEPKPPKPATAPKPRRPAARPIDPRLTAMSRELRDQWAERAGAIVAPTRARHDVKRIAHATPALTFPSPAKSLNSAA